MGKHSRKERPKTKAGAEGTTFRNASEPVDFDSEHPKFCFRYIQGDYDPISLPSDKRGDMLTQMQKLSCLAWKDIKLQHRHKLGTELIPASQISAPIPKAFEDESRFMFFRYSGKLPMGGLRVRDVFHVFWIAKDFTEVYDHG